MSENDISEINIVYAINDEKDINIFGAEFVKNNKDKCKMIIDNKEYEIVEECNVENYNNNLLKIKLKGMILFQELDLPIFSCQKEG